MTNKFPILLLATLFIAGCSSTPEPKKRTPGSAALSLPALSDKWTKGIVQLATKDARGCGRFAANVLPNPVKDDYIFEIDGNKDIFFHIARSEAQGECNMYGMFYANKDSDYIVKFEIKNQKCEFLLTEKSPKGIQFKTSTYTPYVSNVDGTKVCEDKSRLY